MESETDGSVTAFSRDDGKREFRRAHGSDFNFKWLVPGESLVSILWKFGCANALAADFLVQLIDLISTRLWA